MTKKWLIILTMLLSLICFLGCEKEEQYYQDEVPKLAPIVAEYYDDIGISEWDRKNAKVIYNEYKTNDGKTLHFRLPDYWNNIYIMKLGGGEQNDNIFVYEKYNAELHNEIDGFGYLWGIHLFTHEYYAAHFLDDFVNACLEQIGYNAEIIGIDDDYVYLRSFASDVPYDFENELETELYETHWSTRGKFVSDFLSVNDIRPITEVEQ